MILDGAVRDNRCRDVENDRWLLTCRNGNRQRVCAEQRLRAAGERHMVGIRHGRIDPDHIGFQRQGCIDTGSPGVAGHAAADPSDTAFARELDRGLCGPRDHKMTHAIVAVDERRRGSAALHGYVGMWVGRAELEPLHVLRQAKDAVCIGSDQIGLKHQFRDSRRVTLGHAHFDHRINDQAGDGLGWNAYALGRLDVHAFPNRA